MDNKVYLKTAPSFNRREELTVHRYFGLNPQKRIKVVQHIPFRSLPKYLEVGKGD